MDSLLRLASRLMVARLFVFLKKGDLKAMSARRLDVFSFDEVAVIIIPSFRNTRRWVRRHERIDKDENGVEGDKKAPVARGAVGDEET